MTFHELEKTGFSFWDTGDQLKNHVYERSRALFVANDVRRDAIQSVEVLEQRQEPNAINGVPKHAPYGTFHRLVMVACTEVSCLECVMNFVL